MNSIHSPERKGTRMSLRNVVLSAGLTIALALPTWGQENPGGTPKTDDTKQHDMSSMMGAPTVDATVQGLRLKVWIVVQHHQAELKRLNVDQTKMRGDRDGAMERMDVQGVQDTTRTMDKTSMTMSRVGPAASGAPKDTMSPGTHHITLDVKDALIGKEIAHASARVLVVSPSKITSTVDLLPVRGHFDRSLTLDEKGEYMITVSVIVDGVTKTKEFQYVVE
jgi:hypothetical protein